MKEIIEALGRSEFNQANEIVQIAKGKYEYPSTFRLFVEKIKRIIKTRKS